MQLVQRQQQQLHLQQQQSSRCIHQPLLQLPRLDRRQFSSVSVHIKPATYPTPVAQATTGSAVTAVGQSVSAAVAAVADPCLDIDGAQGKAVGSLLAAMCGNALGAQVEPEKHYRLGRMFPQGLRDMSWSFDISSRPLPAGHVTGDYVTMVAVAQAIADCGGADALIMSDYMAASYDASAPEQWYSPYNKLMLEALAAGSNPFLLARHAEGYLASTASRASNTASHRPNRQMHGMSDFTALPRVIPVAVAYREASPQILQQAAEAAVLLTHPVDTVADAAGVLAAAVAWCMRTEASSSSPHQLLEYLLSEVATTRDMKSKLLLLQESLPAVQGLGDIQDWSHFWQSKAWSDVTAVANLLTKQNLAIEATQAVALALWVVVVSWGNPQQAVMLAASLGGYAATTGTLVGGIMGALHGCEWVPAAWWNNLQDAPPAQESPAGGVQAGQCSQSSSKEHGQQQQQPEVQEQEGSTQAVRDAGQQEGADAAAAGDEEAGGVVEGDMQWLLQPLSKYAVVKLGQKLADLGCKEVAPLM